MVISSIEKANMSYGYGFIAWKRPKYDTAGNLFYRKGEHKLGLAIYFIENAEIRHDWGFIPEHSLK